MELLDQEGPAGLSMRKLAVKLGAGATSIYWHVETKDDLLEFVIDEVFGEVDVPDPEVAGWRGGATLFAHSFRATILRHRWFPGVLGGRATIGPNALSLASRAMALLSAAGFTGFDLQYAVSSLIAYVLGTAGGEAAWRSAVNDSGKSTAEWVAEARGQAIEAAKRDYPELGEHIAQWTGTDPLAVHSANFAFGLDCLLDGFAARL